MSLAFRRSTRREFIWQSAAFAAGLASLTAKLAAESAGGWSPLFDGGTLTGWVQRGESMDAFQVRDGEIVGRNARNSFLCTTRCYGDFVLELEFNIPAGLNSGVQIRSHCFEHETKVSWKGKDIMIPAGRVHGYQIEIDPSERAWTGGLYDEGRRGWLQNLESNEAARRAFKNDEWNALRIECHGASIKTWINGVPAVDVMDDMTRSGFIALQVHARPGNTLEVRFRNIRLRESR